MGFFPLQCGGHYSLYPLQGLEVPCSPDAPVESDSEENNYCRGLASMLPQPTAQNRMKMEQWSPTMISWNKLDLGLARVLLILWQPVEDLFMYILVHHTYPSKTCYFVQHCFICRPSDSTVSVDAGMNPGQLRLDIGCQTLSTLGQISSNVHITSLILDQT